MSGPLQAVFALILGVAGISAFIVDVFVWEKDKGEKRFGVLGKLGVVFMLCAPAWFYFILT